METARDDVRVEGSPSRCPWCKGELDRPEALVACAACGARHHDDCHREHGRCASCGGAARLVFDPGSAVAPPAPRAASTGPRPSRDVGRLFGGFLVLAAGLLAAGATLAQLDEPRTGTFLLVLCAAGAFGTAGVRCLRGGPGAEGTGKEPP